MRAARWLCWFWLSACGGRSTVDAVDEHAAGARASAGNGAGAATNEGGAGGRAPVTGGVTSTGGGPTTPPESCRSFCRELVQDCGPQLALDDVLCRSNCEVGFGGSAACDALRVAALGCVQNALAQPMASCADFSRILTADCLIPLTLSATCR